MKPTIKSLLMLSAVLAGTTAAAQANAASADASGSAVFRQDSTLVEIGTRQIQVQKAPFLHAGTLMVPARELALGLNAAAQWTNGSLLLTRGGLSVKLQGSSLQSGGKTVALPAGVQNINGKIYIPLRAAAEALGAGIAWNPASKTAVVRAAASAEQPVSVGYAFEKDAQGWTGGFADLPVQHEDADYQLAFNWSALPAIDGKQLNGLKLSGMNRSDDLFMYAVKKLGAADGLKPNTAYAVKLGFRLATNEASDSVGIGGSPGQSVYVKAGVVNVEPKAVETEGDYRMNLDKGNQATDGKDMRLVGDASKPDSAKEGYQLKPIHLEASVTTNANGEAYLVIGTDSGYEGLSTLYLADVQAEFTPQAK
ncbi:copper amine oxidase N-terminal domain-containing protein [Paenibacillus sp. MWE-103]|uniref:Copper amine oxidase N-terminal domain-containing protein n=1 Tax=Paenibacillus artemisiicola TaxID=1172618 RepID=A0ABS3W358_9BACL|nr:copper amine oxidase N-terminal domain-containing protein [Paenibacillus artemisiicola]MBO7742728.1 copper amine oxidase N-terminal domain-containing protein [Paenibacillus artemisiicola]